MPIEGPTFYVVGNGPSLSTKILDALPRGSWLGMNAAYKYWDTTGRYPHFYACLDPVVVVQHKDAIARLAQEDAIAELFLHEAIFEVMPDLRHHPKVTARDAFLAASQTLPVSAMSKYKQTTGVLATRFCIERGFHNLCLLGIDCNYVERLTQAEVGQGNELVIKNDVGRNPNYFFDNYQEKNEKYQVPNPEIHSGNLHLQSFIALRNDIEASKTGVTIGVGSHESLLDKYNVFPYRNVEALLGLRRLGAVAVPLMPHELDGFLNRLETWVDPKLQPSFKAVKGVVLHLFLACPESAELSAKVEAAVARLPWLGRYFSDVRATFLNMAPEVDYYIKGTSLNVFCNKSGPNLFWFMVMAGCRDYDYAFQMEADCLPVRGGWLDALERAIAFSTPGAWVIGANYSGPTITSATNAFHVNGNAIYATADRKFQDFLDGEFLDALAWLITNVSNNIAYDVAYTQGIAQYGNLLKATGIDLRKYMHRFVHTPVVLNLGGSVELAPDNGMDLLAMVSAEKDAYLGHGRPFIALSDTHFDKFESYFSDDSEGVIELRPHSTAAVPANVLWRYKGFGTVHGAFAETPVAQTTFQFRCDVSQVWGRGDVVISLAPGPFLTVGKFEVSVRRPGKKAKPVAVDLTERNGRMVLRLGQVPKDYGEVTEVVAQFDLSVLGASDGLTIEGLRVLFYPSVDQALRVQFVSRNAAMDAMEQRWKDWRRKGQAQLSEKFRFLNGGAETTILKSLSVHPKSEFARGQLSVQLSGSSEINMHLDPRAATVSDLAVTLVADKDTVITLECAASAFEPTRKLSMAAGRPQSLSLPLLSSKGQQIELILKETGNGNGGKLTVVQLDLPARSEIKPRLISVNPDAESFFGHFLNYEARLGKALRETGQQHIIAGPIDAEPQVYEAHPEMAKVFSGRTNTLYSKTPGAAVPGLDVFEAELDRYLATLDHSTPSQLFMYCGSLEIAEVFGRLAQRYPSCQFAISLYYLSWLNLSDKAMQAYWAPRLAALSAHPKIRLIVPSPELAAEMRAGFGVDTEILPHPTTTFHDQEIGTLQGGNSGDDRITVVFPGNLRGGKGFDLTKDALLALIDQGVDNLRLRVRFPPDDSVNNARRAFFDQIRGKVEIMDSYLDEEAFRELLLSADLVALPYTPDRFSNRTSGLLIDSLLLGVPSVVIDRTWLAGKVRELGFGVVVEESGKALATGIRSAVAEIASLKKAALRARDLYVQENSWSALVSFLNAPGQHLATVSSKALLPADVADTDRVQQSEDTSVPRRMLIIGNGPSARLLAEAGFDKIPADMDTWGTTAAYRYFERVGWWPTYYALADRKVVFHHRDNFARLLDDPKVTSKKFYLSWQVSDSEKLELIPHSSTGSFSLKKAVELGYKEIYLIGMEGAYVEEILESRSLSPEEIEARGFGVLNLSRAESKLRIIDRTPTFNPNYFFSGYQIEGDVYSLPQAHTHQANWDGVKDVVAAAGARVINLSKISKIDAFERGDIRSVFPFLPESCWNDVSDPFTEKAQHAKSVSSMLARGFTEKTPGVWSLSPGNLQKAGLRATFNNPGMTEGRRLVAGLTLTASIDLKLTLTFGREGTTDYEGIGRIVSLKAGKPTNLHLVHHYRNRHKALKLQIADVDLMGHENLDLQINSIFLTESVDSIVARHDADELTDRRASIAFDEGNDSFALGIWLYLREASQDARFDSNIAKVAARIGIPKPYTSSSLGARLICAALPTDKVAPVSQPSTPQVRPAPAIAAPKETAANGHIAARSVLIMAASKLLLGAVGDGLSRQAGPTAQQIADAINLLPKTDETALHYLKVKKFAEENAAGKALNREKH